MTFLKQKKILIFLLLCTILFFQGILKLPVMDRDEARFATATKTMIETKDFVDIKMLEESRYKKPIGIYWSQVLANYIFGHEPYDKIWVYRLPSLFGILVSFLLIYFYLFRIYNKDIAFISIYFLICSILTISEMHQAKTDGLLFLTVNAANLLIFELVRTNKAKNFLKIVFWIILAFGVLIKGPIIFIFALIPLFVFSLLQRNNYFKQIWSWLGLLSFLVITLPWFIAITIKSSGVFWYESVVFDLFNKLKSGQESHGFPPGYYFILIFIFFWPGSIFFPSVLINSIKKWRVLFLDSKEDCFLSLWFLVPLIIYEIVPTKLPHYILPSYSALSILIAKHLFSINFEYEKLKYTTIPLIIFPCLFIGLLLFSIYNYSNPDPFFWLLIFIFLIFTFYLLSINLKKNLKKLLVFVGVFQLCVYLSLIYFLIPKMNVLWISENIAKIVDRNKNDVDEILNYGFNEPSLIFLTSHKSKKIDPHILKENTIFSKKIMYIVSSEYSEIFFKNPKYSDFKLVEKFQGFNYSKGRNMSFEIYKN